MSASRPSLADTQAWSAERYGRDGAFVPRLGAEILRWLDVRPGERVLDLGCGDGVLTAALVEAGAQVTGCDISEPLLEKARARGLDVVTMSGEALTFDAAFDAVFSNAALHWMSDAGAVIDGVWRALKPGGRFVAEFGGHGNVAAIATALRALAPAFTIAPHLAAPWFYPSVEDYQARLEQRGFSVARIGLFPRPTPLETGLRGWLETFRAPFLDAAGARRAELTDALETLLAPALRDEGGRWSADYVRLRVEAVKPIP